MVWWRSSFFPVMRHYHWHTLPSTHTLAVSWTESLAQMPQQEHILRQGGWICLTSSQQTCGVGQFERTFLAPEGGLYLTMVMSWPSTAYVPPVALATGLVVAKQVSADCQVKWVNDVYWNGSKLAGVLVHRQGFASNERTLCIVSIGLNANSVQLPLTFQSIRRVTGKRSNIDTLLHQLIVSLHQMYQHLIQQDGRLSLGAYREIRHRAIHWQEAYDALIPVVSDN